MPDDVSIFVLAHSKLIQLMEEFEQIKSDRNLLDAKEAALTEDWKAWHHIYEREMTVNAAVIAMMAPAEENPALPNPVAQDEQPAPEIVAIPEIEKRPPARNYGAKTVAVRQILADAGIAGISPRELAAELEKRGIKASESFAGNTLFRLRKKGEVFVNSDGKHTLSSLLPKEDFTFQVEDRGA